MKKINLLITLAIPVLLCQNVQAQSSRLTSAATFVHNGAEFKRQDSTAYTYLSTNSGGDLTTAVIKYNDATNWSFVMGDTANNNTRSLQEFDANNNITTNISQIWDGTFTFSWVNQFKHVFFYNTSNKVTSMVIQHWDGSSAWITDSKNVYSYNAANQLYLDQFQIWDGVSAYTPSSQKTYYFDASGNKINETDVIFIAGTPNFTSDTDYTYNSGSKLLTKTSKVWGGASFINNDRITNFYDTTTGNLTNSLYEIFNGTSFENNMQMIFSDFNANHMPLTEIDQTYNTAGSGSWVDVDKYIYTYNTNNQLTSKTQQSNDISIGWTYESGDMKAVYRYASFVSAVGTVSTTGGDANIYPVPAQGMLNVDLNWNQPQAATIAVCDMQGRVIETLNTLYTAKSHNTINISNYASGMYILKATGAQGQIVKQIVVAH